MELKTDDMTVQFSSEDISENRVKAACAYFGMLVLVPLFMAKKSGYARFHANQGLGLLVTGLAYNVMIGMLTMFVLGVSWGFYPVLQVMRFLGFFFPVLAIIGIYNAASGKAKELPVIGKLRLLF